MPIITNQAYGESLIGKVTFIPKNPVTVALIAKRWRGQLVPPYDHLNYYSKYYRTYCIIDE